MFGIKNGEMPKVMEDNTLIPIEKFGIKIMSIGFLIPDQEAVIWRGPMLTKMLQQFLEQVAWGRPDYLIVDLPPGTGDVQLSLSQMIPLTGGLIVTTPQDVALADVCRSVRMFEKTDVPLLGVIENMSYFEAPDTGKRYRIFGGGRDLQRLAALRTEVIGEIPLEIPTREGSDSGQPIVVAEPTSAQALRFRKIAQQIMAEQASANSADEIQLPDLS
jgi:ATP-binding protein involved in chromosome partitioning